MKREIIGKHMKISDRKETIKKNQDKIISMRLAVSTEIREGGLVDIRNPYEYLKNVDQRSLSPIRSKKVKQNKFSNSKEY